MKENISIGLDLSHSQSELLSNMTAFLLHLSIFLLHSDRLQILYTAYTENQLKKEYKAQLLN